MNRTKIEYADYTWNPVTGCLHGCPYCYAARIAKRFVGHFDPTFHADRLDEPKRVKKSARIFVSSMGDILGKWVLREHVQPVIDVVRDCPQHTFLFLTKNPERYREFDWPGNAWLGTSIEEQDVMEPRLRALLGSSAAVQWVSLEPLLGQIDLEDWARALEWVVVGAQTGPKSVKPETAWIETLIRDCDNGHTPIFLKNNLRWPSKRQEYPR